MVTSSGEVVTVDGTPVVNSNLRDVKESEVSFEYDESYSGSLKMLRRQHIVQGYKELLHEDLSIQMMQVPAGSFMMGSSEDELEQRSSEGPQRQVDVPAFFMGKYPVTQSQWRIVAELPQVNRELKPNPSQFEGDNNPVESISWFEAVEFCDRLSLHTGRPLPTTHRS